MQGVTPCIAGLSLNLIGRVAARQTACARTGARRRSGRGGARPMLNEAPRGECTSAALLAPGAQAAAAGGGGERRGSRVNKPFSSSHDNNPSRRLHNNLYLFTLTPPPPPRRLRPPRPPRDRASPPTQRRSSSRRGEQCFYFFPLLLWLAAAAASRSVSLRPSRCCYEGRGKETTGSRSKCAFTVPGGVLGPGRARACTV